jgi:hypothetical protein
MDDRPPSPAHVMGSSIAILYRATTIDEEQNGATCLCARVQSGPTVTTVQSNVKSQSQPGVHWSNSVTAESARLRPHASTQTRHHHPQHCQLNLQVLVGPAINKQNIETIMQPMSSLPMHLACASGPHRRATIHKEYMGLRPISQAFRCLWRMYAKTKRIAYLAHPCIATSGIHHPGQDFWNPAGIM